MTPKPLALDQNGRAVFVTALWQILGRLDSSQQAQAYLNAAASKDDLTLLAFDSWPAYDPAKVIDSNSVAQGKAIRAQVENEDAAAELRELQQLDALLRSGIATMEAQVGTPDELTVAAGGPLRLHRRKPVMKGDNLNRMDKWMATWVLAGAPEISPFDDLPF